MVLSQWETVYCIKLIDLLNYYYCNGTSSFYTIYKVPKNSDM